jgi:hypothetical protein
MDAHQSLAWAGGIRRREIEAPELLGFLELDGFHKAFSKYCREQRLLGFFGDSGLQVELRFFAEKNFQRSTLNFQRFKFGSKSSKPAHLARAIPLALSVRMLLSPRAAGEETYWQGGRS